MARKVEVQVDKFGVTQGIKVDDVPWRDVVEISFKQRIREISLVTLTFPAEIVVTREEE